MMISDKFVVVLDSAETFTGELFASLSETAQSAGLIVIVIMSGTAQTLRSKHDVDERNHMFRWQKLEYEALLEIDEVKDRF